MGDECVERGYCQQLFWYLEEKTKSEDSLDIVHELNMIGKSSPMYMVRYYILIKLRSGIYLNEEMHGLVCTPL